MYIISNIGFFSLARLSPDQDDGPTFAIRARARQDLHNLLTAARLEARIQHTPERDYPWRILADPDQLRRVLLALGESVGKGGELKNHPTRGDLYATIWAVLTKIRDE